MTNPHALERASRYRMTERGFAVRKRTAASLQRYGLTVAQFEAMEHAQDYRCLICEREERLHVDHDHDAGRVRGLLCVSCNTGLGRFRDNPDALARAILYLVPGYE